VALVLAPPHFSRARRSRGALLALALSALTALALASCGSSAPKSSATKTLAAPLISEHFTRLPCNHATTIGLEGCAETQLLEGDHRIDAEVKLLFTLVPAVQKKALVHSENTFLAYRHATCLTYSDVYKGGSFQPVEYALCEVRVDNEQSSVLHGYFNLAQSGASHSLKWP
jgi:uncharacterized protein YecT (DUF1311 family)